MTGSEIVDIAFLGLCLTAGVYFLFVGFYKLAVYFTKED
jgi:hypothetical protein